MHISTTTSFCFALKDLTTVRENAFLLSAHKIKQHFPQTHEKEHVEPVVWLNPVNRFIAREGELLTTTTRTDSDTCGYLSYHYCTFNALEETLILYSGILSVLKILDNEQPIRLQHYSTTH